jgi:16S rRNA processing protein RimM
VTATNPDAPVLMVECGRAVGLKGEIRMKCYLEDQSRLCEYNPYTDKNGREYVIQSFRALPSEPHMVVAKIVGVTTRTQAEALNRTPLYTPRERLGSVEEDDTYFLADLMGLCVKDASGTILGHVLDVVNYGAGDILDVKLLAEGPSVLVPFYDPFVTDVDIDGGFVVISDASLLEITPPRGGSDRPPSKRAHPKV